MVKSRVTRIKKKFDQDGLDITRYIREKSEQNAKKFIAEVDKIINIVEKSPEIFSNEPYLPTKQNWYRFALVMKSWKVIYKVTNNMLVFLGIIHTARHPKEIKKLRTKNYK